MEVLLIIFQLLGFKSLTHCWDSWQFHSWRRISTFSFCHSMRQLDRLRHIRIIISRVDVYWTKAIGSVGLVGIYAVLSGRWKLAQPSYSNSMWIMLSSLASRMRESFVFFSHSQRFKFSIVLWELQKESLDLILDVASPIPASNYRKNDRLQKMLFSFSPSLQWGASVLQLLVQLYCVCEIILL